MRMKRPGDFGGGGNERRVPGSSHITSVRLAGGALALASVLLVSLAAQPPSPPAVPVPVVAIRGGTLLTVTAGTIPNGTIVLQGGKIAALGRDVPVPAGAEVVDASGRFVSPGLIDCHSHIAVDSINEGGTTVSSMTGTDDVLNPTDINIYRDLAGGLTAANVLHGSANPIGGKNSVIKLRWGKTRPEELLFDGALPGIKFALGENPKRPGGGRGSGPRRYPGTRLGVEYVIRDALTRAQAYHREWQEYDRRRKAGEDVVPPRRDLQLEPLVEVLEGKRLVHAHSYRADEILMLIGLAEEFGFKVATFQHVLEGYKVAKEIAAHGAGASTFSDWWGYKIEAIDAIPQNAALMTRKGVVVSVNSDSAEHARRLNSEAAKSVKWGGLSDDEALALVTINPAKQLRIDHRVGSLEAGKDADIVIWNHHPLSSYAIVDRVYIDGQRYYDRFEDQKRLTELAREKASLAARAAQAAGELHAETPETSGSHAADSHAGDSHAADGHPAVGHAAAQNNRSTDSSGSSGPRDSTLDNPGLPPRLSPSVPAARQSARSSPSSRRSVLAITNARIFPITKPAIDRGAIIISDGIIQAVGGDVAVPAGATIIDAAGSDVYPGFIDANSTLGLADPGASGFADADEILDFNPQLRPEVAFHNDSDAIPVARANGVTTVALMPGGGLLGGQIAVMNLDGWTWEESIVKSPVGVTFQFPSIGGGGGRGGGEGGRGAGPPQPPRTYQDLKKERDARLDQVARLLDDARAYAKELAAGESRKPGWRKNWQLEALIPIVEKRAPLVTRVNTERDLRDALAFAERAGVRLVISGGSEAPMVAPLLRDKGVPVILGSVLTLPSREDLPHQASYAAAGDLVKAGVKIAFSSGGPTNARQLPYEAAQSVAWGLPRDDALKALTIGAAEILGVADRIGSIEPGKVANLIVSRGDPLEVRTVFTHVLIAGHDVGLSNRQLALYERYARRP